VSLLLGYLVYDLLVQLAEWCMYDESKLDRASILHHLVGIVGYAVGAVRALQIDRDASRNV
ncbi:Hypothetical protein UVM_LOCUS287, partial [uncultured virus]